MSVLFNVNLYPASSDLNFESRLYQAWVFSADSSPAYHSWTAVYLSTADDDSLSNHEYIFWELLLPNRSWIYLHDPPLEIKEKKKQILWHFFHFNGWFYFIYEYSDRYSIIIYLIYYALYKFRQSFTMCHTSSHEYHICQYTYLQTGASFWKIPSIQARIEHWFAAWCSKTIATTLQRTRLDSFRFLYWQITKPTINFTNTLVILIPGDAVDLGIMEYLSVGNILVYTTIIYY